MRTAVAANGDVIGKVEGCFVSPVSPNIPMYWIEDGEVFQRVRLECQAFNEPDRYRWVYIGDFSLGMAKDVDGNPLFVIR